MTYFGRETREFQKFTICTGFKGLKAPKGVQIKMSHSCQKSQLQYTHFVRWKYFFLDPHCNSTCVSPDLQCLDKPLVAFFLFLSTFGESLIGSRCLVAALTSPSGGGALPTTWPSRLPSRCTRCPRRSTSCPCRRSPTCRRGPP